MIVLIRFQRLVAAGTLLVTTASPPASRAAEVWLTPERGRAEATGTRQNPYPVPTAEAFDQRLRELPAGTVIHLLPGTYETKGGTTDAGGFQVRSGWQIRGAGMDRTTVRLTGFVRDQGGATGVGRVFFNGWGPGVSNVVIADLTVDANGEGIVRAAGTPRMTTEAVRLQGRDLLLERVRAVGAVGRRNAPGVNPESFILQIGPHSPADRTASFRILGCEVRDFAGGNCTAISLFGPDRADTLSGGLVRSNRITLGGTGGEFGFAAYGDGVIVEFNQVTGASRAFNWDTPKNGRRTIIRTNQFLRCTGYALCLGGGADGLVEGNLIELAGNGALGVLLSARNDTFPGASGWVIRGNTFRAASGRPGVAAFHRNAVAPGSVFENNVLEPALELRARPQDFARWRGNRQPDGTRR